jgi:hypothetical protein
MEPEPRLDDLAIPGCEPWRTRNPDDDGKPADLCPSVHCDRCQTLRLIAGGPVLTPYVGGQDG